MTRSFNSFGAFAAHLRKVPKGPMAAASVLKAIGVLVEGEARARIGIYQRANMGPFEPWEELADETKEDRERRGFAPNDPLLVEGSLRDSISHEVAAGTSIVGIGSSTYIGLWQELGTKKIPPRSFLGSALFSLRQEIGSLVGTSVQQRIVTGSV